LPIIDIFRIISLIFIDAAFADFLFSPAAEFRCRRHLLSSFRGFSFSLSPAEGMIFAFAAVTPPISFAAAAFRRRFR